jgi:hypothetical protein
MKVTLKKAHEHAGVRYDAGTEIEVTAPEADWLAEQGVIDQPAVESKTAKAAKESA